jgi:YegS/Rv2252/BmrU family lipid kinase
MYNLFAHGSPCPRANEETAIIMRVRIIVNPQADLGRSRGFLDAIGRAAQQLGDCEIMTTMHRWHATELAAEAARAGYGVVIAAGGDGTVHEVINGLCQIEAPRPHLGVLPIGSGNDFAYSAGIPLDRDEAVTHLSSGRTRTIDLALVEDDRGRREFFHNNFGVGFDASVVIRTAEITRIHGFMMYLWGVLKTLALDFRPYKLAMQFDGNPVTGELIFIAFGLGQRHGGGFLLTPDARGDDNLVDSCSVDPISRVRALSMLVAAVKGTHVSAPFVNMRRNSVVEISAIEPLPIHIDGEVFATPGDNVRWIRVTSIPAALEVIA